MKDRSANTILIWYNYSCEIYEQWYIKVCMLMVSKWTVADLSFIFQEVVKSGGEYNMSSLEINQKEHCTVEEVTYIHGRE